ncbi:MAG: HAD-IA family hydrolase [Candidatus Bathyarchaeia archaeon]|nr:HAD-IA family hydrolase [Candidatus Bathyarchaeota archaeon]
MGSVKAVIFDLDDTLIYSGINYYGVKASVIRFLVEVGVDSNAISENMPNLEIIRAAVKDLRSKGMSEIEIKRVLNHVDSIMDRAEIDSLGNARLREDSLEVLKSLKERGLKIGIITNGCRDYATRVIEMFSLNSYVDVLVARDDVINQKPSPEPLLKALKILGFSAGEIIFVGDHWIDALCAERAGVKFILLQNKRWNFEGLRIRAMAVIEDLRDIVRLL